MAVQSITLNNGVQMPMLGYGTFQIQDAEQCEACVTQALQLGYRLIDTAAAYLNEEAIGFAIKRSGIPRSELFVISKLWLQDAGYENTRKAFDSSLQRLGLEYLDLYLIHHPFGDTYGSWKAMEEFQKEGRICAIGVCNFSPERLADLCLNSTICPAVNQIELHPFYQQPDALHTMQEYDVKPQGWGPLAEGQKEIFKNPILTKIGAKHGKTAAQVTLRWNLQRGVAVIPKTVHLQRMEENLNVLDFELTAKEISQISSMDIGHSEIIDHRSACTAKWLNGWQIHD